MSTNDAMMSIEQFNQWVLEGEQIYKDMLELAEERPDVLPACDIFKDGLGELTPMVKEYQKLMDQILALEAALEEKSNELDKKLLPYEELLSDVLPISH